VQLQEQRRRTDAERLIVIAVLRQPEVPVRPRQQIRLDRQAAQLRESRPARGAQLR
jgi:hypothetical protein